MFGTDKYYIQDEGRGHEIYLCPSNPHDEDTVQQSDSEVEKEELVIYHCLWTQLTRATSKHTR